MFRALFLLILMAGAPQIPAGNGVNFDADLLAVNNFQLVSVNLPQPIISAKSALAIDLDSFVPLFQFNPEQKLPVASLTKLLTALIILEENQLEDVVTINAATTQVEGSRIWLYPEETITVGDLLQGMLIASGNDAAYALAQFNAGSLSAFSQKMQKMALILDLKNSHFTNPAGLDDEKNYSTVRDLALIAKHILKNTFIRQSVSLPQAMITSADGQISHKLINTNQLLGGFLDAQGVKTGTTDLAGQCLISLVKIKGNEVLIIVLGSQDRYQDTKAIYNVLESSL